MEKIMKKIKDKEKYFKIVFVLFVFSFCFIWSISQPYDTAPDEYMKYDICKYLVNNGKLPHGGDESIRNPIWGISYAFQPILAYMVSAVFMKIVMLITKLTVTDFAVVVAARFVSVLCCTGTVIVVMKIAEKLFKDKKFKWMFIVFVSLLPQFIFLGSYINNDSLALLTIAIIIYSWIIGIESNWNWKSCITLAIAIGVCALSYYNAYTYILCSIILFIISFIKNKRLDYKNMLKKGIVISAIVLSICGWFFVRNIIIYDGDILGLQTEKEYSQKYAMEGYKPDQLSTPLLLGLSLKDMLIGMKWINLTFKSFIAMFGYMSIVGPFYLYNFYKIVFLLGVIGCIISIKDIFLNKDKNRSKLHYFFILAMISTVALSLYYSYASDYQPQGRYIMPAMIPFMYFLVIGIQKLISFIKFKYVKIAIIIVICIIWTYMPIMCLTNLIIPFYRNL